MKDSGGEIPISFDDLCELFCMLTRHRDGTADADALCAELQNFMNRKDEERRKRHGEVAEALKTLFVDRQRDADEVLTLLKRRGILEPDSKAIFSVH
jgi:hypothetical protein